MESFDKSIADKKISLTKSYLLVSRALCAISNGNGIWKSCSNRMVTPNAIQMMLHDESQSICKVYTNTKGY